MRSCTWYVGRLFCKDGNIHRYRQRFRGDVTVTITVDSNGKITAVESTGEKETEAIGGAALATLDANLLEAQSAEFDGVAGATLTSNGYKEAAAAAIAQSKGEEENLEISFKPGTYTGKGKGYNGEVVARCNIYGIRYRINRSYTDS